MTRNNKLRQLRRRADFLKDRISNYSGKSDSFDRAEESAIRWAIKIVENVIADDTIMKYEAPDE